jgi:succinate dehydrogenase / fumarate reductase iron-sulfur subunit
MLWLLDFRVNVCPGQAGEAADTAFDAAACIGCGACVAACPNAAAMLFTSAKVTHLNALPQGQPQRDERTLSMVVAMANVI